MTVQVSVVLNTTDVDRSRTVVDRTIRATMTENRCRLLVLEGHCFPFCSNRLHFSVSLYLLL